MKSGRDFFWRAAKGMGITGRGGNRSLRYGGIKQATLESQGRIAWSLKTKRRFSVIQGGEVLERGRGCAKRGVKENRLPDTELYGSKHQRRVSFMHVRIGEKNIGPSGPKGCDWGGPRQPRFVIGCGGGLHLRTGRGGDRFVEQAAMWKEKKPGGRRQRGTKIEWRPNLVQICARGQSKGGGQTKSGETIN